MNNYEVNFILHPEEEIAKKGIEVIDNFVKENGGEIKETHNIGIKRLRYNIKKHEKGYYYRLDVKLPPSCMGELDHLTRVTDPILKYMPINLNK